MAGLRKDADLPLEQVLRSSCGRCPLHTWRKAASLSPKTEGRHGKTDRQAAKSLPVDILSSDPVSCQGFPHLPTLHPT